MGTDVTEFVPCSQSPVDMDIEKFEDRETDVDMDTNFEIPWHKHGVMSMSTELCERFIAYLALPSPKIRKPIRAPNGSAKPVIPA